MEIYEKIPGWVENERFCTQGLQKTDQKNQKIRD
jgi:hypothetical protein